MVSPKFVDQLNAQIGHEFEAHQQYVSIAAYYDSLTMQRLAAFFYRQAVEERSHAMMMIKYLVDSDAEVHIPALETPVSSFDDVVEPVVLALAQERRVQEQVHELTSIARCENDFASDQFMLWFIKEQVEEIATVTDLLAVVRRSSHDVEAIEDYVMRETATQGSDATAPTQAGAGA